MSDDDYKRAFYPEIVKHGSLKQALKVEFEKIESELKDKIDGFAGYPELRVKQRSASVTTATEKRLFLCSFRNYDITSAIGNTMSLSDAARSMHNWLILKVKSSDLAKDFDFIKLSERGKVFEQGNYVEWNWQNYEKVINKEFPELISVFQEAKRNEKLRKHIIFTSLNRLGFSNCKIGHISFDVLITPLPAEKFTVSIKDKKENLEGFTPEAAIQAVAENIKDECLECNGIK
ncbi:MAG TPA: DUF6193 family natural product biosynthesis protein [Pyrinomonadaceae bacterium]|nr:DUF6193 family natural product biosynthesis protein [Pyrinomonadaceae bacterium]